MAITKAQLARCIAPLVMAIYLGVIMCIPQSSLFAAIDPVASTQTGLTETAEASGIKTNNSILQLANDIFKTIFGILGVIFLGLMIFAGFKWMVAQGNQAEADKARDIIFHAVIGLVIILASYALTNYVFDKLVKKTLDQ